MPGFFFMVIYSQAGKFCPSSRPTCPGTGCRPLLLGASSSKATMTAAQYLLAHATTVPSGFRISSPHRTVASCSRPERSNDDEAQAVPSGKARRCLGFSRSLFRYGLAFPLVQ